MEENNALDRVGSGKGEYIKILEKFKNLDYIQNSCDFININGSCLRRVKNIKGNCLADILADKYNEDSSDVAEPYGLDWDTASKIFRDVAYALMQFHNNGLLFTGLNLRNIYAGQEMNCAKLVYDIGADLEIMKDKSNAADDVYRLGMIMCTALDSGFSDASEDSELLSKHLRFLSTKCPDYVMWALQRAIWPDAEYRTQTVYKFMQDMKWDIEEPRWKDEDKTRRLYDTDKDEVTVSIDENLTSTDQNTVSIDDVIAPQGDDTVWVDDDKPTESSNDDDETIRWFPLGKVIKR